MSKAGHIGVGAPSRLVVPASSPTRGPSLWLEHRHPTKRGTSGQGFGSVRLFLRPYQSEVWRSFARWARGPVAGGGVSMHTVPVRRYSHFFEYFADVAHQFVSSVGSYVGQTDREYFRHAQKDFAFGAKNE